MSLRAKIGLAVLFNAVFTAAVLIGALAAGGSAQHRDLNPVASHGSAVHN